MDKATLRQAMMKLPGFRAGSSPWEDGAMAEQRRPGRYSTEFRERAVLVFETEQHTEPPWKAICSVADRLDPNSETVRKWVHQAEIDQRRRDGVTTAEDQRIRELEGEIKDLRRANEILKTASAFCAAELDGRRP
jgi:transposase